MKPNFFSVLVTVPIYVRKGGKRDYNKADYCFYCSKKISSKITRHLISNHSDRKLVRDSIMAKGNEKNKLLYRVRQLGNYQHNIEVMSLPN